MAQEVAKVGVKKEKGWLYFIDRHGDVSRAKMARGRKRTGSKSCFYGRASARVRNRAGGNGINTHI